MSDQAAMMRAKGYCTAIEAAEALGIHISNVYRAEVRGAIAGTKLGRSRYIEIGSLVRYATKDDPRMMSKLDGLRKLVTRVRRAMVPT